MKILLLNLLASTSTILYAKISMKKLQLPVILLIFTLLSSGFTFQTLAQVNRTFSVNATIPPKASDFQFGMTTDKGGTVPQETTLTYTITYGASSSAELGTTNTIIVNYNDDKAHDGTHVTDYVIGSASDAYGGAQPVVDTIHRTISWTIPNLPAGTIDQTVMFRLHTNSNYSTNRTTNFTVRATMSNQYASMTEQTQTNQYLFDATLVKPGPTKPVTATPEITPSVTPSPPPAPQIADISVNTISASQATIRIVTTRLTKKLVRFGTSPTQLNQSVQNDQFTTADTLVLPNLAPATTYYFQISAIDRSGRVARSERFTFRTAEPSQLPVLDRNIVVVSENGTLLLADITGKNSPFSRTVLVTSNSEFEFSYTLMQPVLITSIDAILRNKVLGDNTFTPGSGSTSITIPMFTKSRDVYTANINTFYPGTFEVFVRIADTKGNISEQKIADIKVIPHFSVYEADTNSPLPDTRVEFFYYNEFTKKYERISERTHKFTKNPNYTNIQGEIDTTLPKGKYKANISNFGYEQKTVAFTLGPQAGEEFPKVYLKKVPFNLPSVALYIQNNIVDLYNRSINFIFSLSSSVRFFNLISLATIVATVVITFLLFSIRTHIHPRHLPGFLLYLFHRITHKEYPVILSGHIIDEQKNPLSKARIDYIDERTGNLIFHFHTTKSGSFYFRPTHGITSMKLLVTREGYVPAQLHLGNDSLTSSQEDLVVMLRQGEQPRYTFFRFILKTLEHAAGLLFEFFMVCSLILEIFFFSFFGIGYTLPFFAISIGNMLLWFFYLHERKY